MGHELPWIGLHECEAVKTVGTLTKEIACLLGRDDLQVPISWHIRLFYFPVAELHDKLGERLGEAHARVKRYTKASTEDRGALWDGRGVGSDNEEGMVEAIKIIEHSES